MLVPGIIGAADFFIVLLQCNTPREVWNVESPYRRCVNRQILAKAALATTCVNAWAGWSFDIIAAFIVWSLNIPRRQKLEMAGLIAFAVM
jgi:hypothetical protein